MTTLAQDTPVKRRDAKTFFEILTKDNMYLVDDFYAEDVHFQDPVVEFHNREDMKHYYQSSYDAVQAISFEIPQVVEDGDHQVILWKMNMTAKKLNKGEPIIVDGISYIRYNKEGLAVYHRDYFDMGAMMYRNVPVVRWFVDKVDKKMREYHDPTHH